MGDSNWCIAVREELIVTALLIDALLGVASLGLIGLRAVGGALAPPTTLSASRRSLRADGNLPSMVRDNRGRPLASPTRTLLMDPLVVRGMRLPIRVATLLTCVARTSSIPLLRRVLLVLLVAVIRTIRLV